MRMVAATRVERITAIVLDMEIYNQIFIKLQVVQSQNLIIFYQMNKQMQLIQTFKKFRNFYFQTELFHSQKQFIYLNKFLVFYNNNHNFQLLLNLFYLSSKKIENIMPDKNQHQKLINARLMKWREMLQKGLYSDKQLLIKRTHKGIPPSIRIVVWPEISKLKNFVQRQPLTYSKVLLKDSRDIYEIKLDVPRTFSFQSQQVLRQSLFNVLKALSVQFPHIGYCQGMNFLSMRLLQILDDETVFYVISCILKKNKSIYDNFRNPGFVNRQNEVFSIYLQKFMPKLNKKLKEHFIQPYMYTTQWFLTLFSKSLDKQKFYRFFQCFLVDGYATIYKAGLTLMKFKQKQILDNGMQENILFISDMEFYNKFNDDQFIKQMLKFQLNLEEIQKIQKQYSYRNKATFKKLQDTVMTTYTKKIQEPRNIFEWTLQDFKKTDFQYVSFDD